MTVHTPITIARAPQTIFTLQKIKKWLRVTHDGDDDIIGDLIEQGIERAETILDKSLVDCTYRIFLDAFPACDGRGRLRVNLPRPPVKSIESFNVLVESGVTKSLAAELDYWPALNGDYPYLRPVSSWPILADRPQGVMIEFKTEKPTFVKRDIEVGIMVLIGFYYANREAANLQQGASGYAELPGVTNAERILMAHARPRI